MGTIKIFDHIGSKIKNFAKILFWISIVLSVAIGICVCAILCSIRLTALGILCLVGIISLGFMFAWVGSFFLIGYGQLIEDCDKIRETNVLLFTNMIGKKLPIVESATSARQNTATENAVEKAKINTKWICAYCGSENPEQSEFCAECGFPKSEPYDV